MKHWYKATLALLLAALVLGGNVTSAQTVVTGQAGVPAGFTVMPVQNLDRGDDQILQLNTLTIQGMNGNVLYASRTDGATCLGFRSTYGYGAPIACPQIAPTVLYQIAVQPDTILLLRNRARTSFGTFSVGDRINVFGFVDPSSNYVQALIVRDLDKPSVGIPGGSYYTQFNNVNALTAPSAPFPPASFDIVFSPQPCVLYSGPAGYPIGGACPYVPAAPSGVFALAKHAVNVSAQTVILNQLRQTAPLSIIQPGDSLNVFGSYNPQTGVIDALIVRDLSRSSITPVPYGASLQVTVVDNTIQCITAPCGLMPGVNVNLSGPTNATAVTNSAGQASFGNLPSGTYTVTAVRGDGRTAASSVTIPNGGGTQYVTLYLTQGSTTGSLQVQAPNGGEAMTRGTTYQVRWMVPSIQPGQVSAGNSFDIFLVHKMVGGDAIGNVQYPIASGVFLDFGMTMGSYNWNVGTYRPDGCSLPSGYCTQAIPSVADGGNYYIRVCYANTYTCDESDGPFTIGNGGQTGNVTLYSVSPSYGSAGTTITLTGSGFTSFGNTVQMSGNGDGVYLPNVNSAGNSVSFSMPNSSSYSCQYSYPACMLPNRTLSPGIYQVWVTNANGTSNQLTFTLQGGSTSGNLSIVSINPQSGYPNTWATIVGNGFLSGSDNRIIIDGQYSAGSATFNNSTSLSFNLPDYVGPYCQAGQACPQYMLQLPAGQHSVAVENANGRSNGISFQLFR